MATHPGDSTADVRLLYIVAVLRGRNEDICASFQLSHGLGLRKTFDFLSFNYFSHKYNMRITLVLGREASLLLLLFLLLLLLITS